MFPTRILIADTPESVEICRPCLTGPFALVQAGTLDEATHELRGRIDMVVCGVHFDEGRMYDLLRHLKRSPRLERLPFVAVRCLEGELEFDGALRESVKIAVKALGGNAFVDLLRWQREYGAHEAGRRFTELLQQLTVKNGPDAVREPTG